MEPKLESTNAFSGLRLPPISDGMQKSEETIVRPPCRSLLEGCLEQDKLGRGLSRPVSHLPSSQQPQRPDLPEAQLSLYQPAPTTLESF